MYTVLEFIIDFYNMDKATFAESLGITKQQLNSWLSNSKSKRPIPKKWKEVLSEKYKLDEDYFTKEIDKEEQLQLFEHLLKINDVTTGDIDNKVEILEGVGERFDLHSQNVERLQSLLFVIHETLSEAIKDDITDENINLISMIEDQFVERVHKFLNIIEENDKETMQKLDEILNK